MDTDSYIAFLLVSALLVVLDAVIITISGRKYLRDDDHPGVSLAASWLTTTLFTLIVLGLVALISTVDLPVEGELQKLVTKLGIVLLLLAVAHGITMAVLTRFRGEERQEHLAEELAEQSRGHTRTPEVSRSIERDEPYSAV
jgi:succinate-acetate transporter protein